MDKGLAEKISAQLRRLDDFLDDGLSGFRRRRMPMRHMFRILPEMAFGMKGEVSEAAVLAIAASMFKDSMPWVYEVGMEAYRQQLYGDKTKAKRAMQEFKKVARFTDHPMMREFIRGDKEMMHFGDELEMVLSELERRQEAKLEVAKARQKNP